MTAGGTGGYTGPMAARTLAVSALLLASALPARAEFCFLDSQRDGTPVVYELGGAQCGGGNRLVFSRRYGSDRYPENHETFLLDSWPMFQRSDVSCAAAERGTRWMTDCPSSVIVGKTVMSGPQFWVFLGGGCSTFRSRFTAKKSELVAQNGKENVTSEQVLKAIDAGESSARDLRDKVIELGQNLPKKRCGEK